PRGAVWPVVVTDPRNDRARSEYYDSLYHSALVVGLNTSALIEAAIVGRRTYTFTLPELAGGQEGTLHFHYLVAENGGPLTVGRNLDEHVAHLAQALAEPAEAAPSRDFVRSFVRPNGLDRDATPILVDDVEALVAALEPSPVRQPRGALLLEPLAWAVNGRRARKAARKARRRARRRLVRRTVRL